MKRSSIHEHAGEQAHEGRELKSCGSSERRPPVIRKRRGVKYGGDSQVQQHESHNDVSSMSVPFATAENEDVQSRTGHECDQMVHIVWFGLQETLNLSVVQR